MSTIRSPIRLVPVTESGGEQGAPEMIARAARDAAVLLIGQGSTRSGRPDRTLCRHTAALAAQGTFAEVRAATLAGTPPPRQVLAQIGRRYVFVVPVLMCDGLLCRSAVPAALGVIEGQAGPIVATGDNYLLHFCPPVGIHPLLARLVLLRAQQGLEEAGFRAAETTVLLIGHGSTRNPASAQALAHQAERVRTRAHFRAVAIAFIGQAPHLADELTRLPRPVIGIALFAARGNHVVHDIEARFSALDAADCLFAGAIGEDHRFITIIETIVKDHLKIGHNETSYKHLRETFGNLS